jgi:AraC-like DNA-binding protein
MAVTHVESDAPEVKCDASGPRMMSVANADAFLVAVSLGAVRAHELWEDGVPRPVERFSAGDSSIYDLRRNPSGHIREPFRIMSFYLPLRTLNEMADEHAGPRIDEIVGSRPGARNEDPVMRHLALALLSDIDHANDASALFLDHFTLTVCAHVARTYCGMGALKSAGRGRLAQWQIRRAQDLLVANLGGNVSISELASECRLSPSQFARAFRRTTGMPPPPLLARRSRTEGEGPAPLVGSTSYRHRSHLRLQHSKPLHTRVLWACRRQPRHVASFACGSA